MKVSLPEQIWIDIEPAGYGSRALAYMVDFSIRWTIVAAFVISLFLLHSFVSTESLFSVFDGWIGSVFEREKQGLFILSIAVIIIFLLEWSYPIFFEVFRDGATPGKKMFGLRVVNERGLPINFRSSFLRTALLAVDLMPGIGFVGLVSMFCSSKSQRLGDIAARTIVVNVPAADAYELPERVQRVGEEPILLPLKLCTVLEQYLKRRKEFAEEAAFATANKLASALRPHLPQDISEQNLNQDKIDAWLMQIYRRSIPEKRTQAHAKQDVNIDWQQVHRELKKAEHMLLELESKSSSLSAEKLNSCADAYQSLCQSYAYLSTFYPETNEARNAARLVRLGRRLIYGRRLDRAQDRSAPFLERVPDAFHELRGYCAVAALIAIASGVITALLIQITPSFAWYFLNEETAAKLQQGQIWTDDIQGLSSLAASRIMTNNITVTFTVFAMGITGGIGTVLVLVGNGAMLGGIFAALAPYDMAARLFEFILAHGVLELSVIMVAGGCGLAFGDALLSPGSQTRRAKLQERARTCVDLLLFSALCLVPAGVVEGFVSPYPQIPWLIKLIVGLSLGFVYWSYLISGVFNPLQGINKALRLRLRLSI